MWETVKRRCHCPNHRHALARQVIVVIPLRRVEHDPLEALNTWNGWKRRFAEWPIAKDEDIGNKLTLRSGDVPGLVVFVPRSVQQLAVALEGGTDAKALYTVPGRSLDHGLGRRRPVARAIDL